MSCMFKIARHGSPRLAGWPLRSVVPTFVVISWALSFLLAQADEAAKDTPRVAMCVPLGVAVGATTKVILRGWALDNVKEVRSPDPRIVIKVLTPVAAAVPNGQDANQIGDKQVELEVSVAEGVEPGEFSITLVSPAGESKPHDLFVGSTLPLIAEIEPNDGLRQAQQIAIPQVIDGQIHADRTVDVYSFEIAATQHVTIETIARRHGSGLDSLLTLYDSRVNSIAVSDDLDGTTDSRISMILSAGRYFINLQDANDHGGPAHPYRLVIQITE